MKELKTRLKQEKEIKNNLEKEIEILQRLIKEKEYAVKMQDKIINLMQEDLKNK